MKWVPASRPGETTTPGTQLFADLNKALADTPPDRLAGVILLTDGEVHDVPKQAAALGFDAPVHALLTGAPDEFDRRIQILKAPRYGIVGQSRDIEVAVRETGKESDAAESVTLKVRREGRPDERITTTIDRPVKIEMPFPHAGQNILEVELDTAPGELTPANNRAVIAAEGVRENLRVLLVSGEPHAGERTWRNLLKSDAAVDLVHFTILRPPEKHDGTPINQLSLIAFPTRELFSEKINDFDLIIFDRYQHRGLLQLPYYDNIARYVEDHGGALLVAAGDDYAGNMSLFRTPLSPVLPAIPTGRVLSEPFKAKLTADGRKHPVTEELPGAGTATTPPTWGRWFRQVEVQPETRTRPHGRRRERAPPHPRPQGQGPRRAADLRPGLAVGARLRGRRPAQRSAAPAVALADEGAGPGGGAPHRLGQGAEAHARAPLHGGQGRAGHAVGARRRDLRGDAGAGRRRHLALDRRREDPRPLQGPDEVGHGRAHRGRARRHRRSHRDERGDGDRQEAAADHRCDRRRRVLDQRLGGSRAQEPVPVDVPRVSMLSSAKVLAGSGWLGLKDREAYVTRGVKLTPMFTGFTALSALLLLIALAWWREGR